VYQTLPFILFKYASKYNTQMFLGSY